MGVCDVFLYASVYCLSAEYILPLLYFLTSHEKYHPLSLEVLT